MKRRRQTKDHNGEHWLEIRFLTKGYHHFGCPPVQPGWYCIRVCPCHSGMPVTVAFDTQDKAEQARQAMLAASRKLKT